MELTADVIYGIVFGAAIPFILWALNKWKTINADGVVTVDEVIETITEGVDEVKEVVDIIEDLTND